MKLSQMLLVALLLGAGTTLGFAQSSSSITPAEQKLTDVVLKDVDAKESIKHLVGQLKLNVVFDESVRVPGKLDLELKAVSLEAALKIIFMQTKLRASWVEWNTLYIYADMPQLRERFSEFKVWEAKISQHP